MTFEHIHREEATHVGDPADATVQDLAGIAPPCDECGKREAVEQQQGRHLCGDCLSS